MTDAEYAAAFLAYWCDQCTESVVEPFIRAANMVKNHWNGIISFLTSKVSNGILDGINSKIQLAKRRARGYRNTTNLINMIYFLCGKLKFAYPHYFI